MQKIMNMNGFFFILQDIENITLLLLSLLFYFPWKLSNNFNWLVNEISNNIFSNYFELLLFN